MKLRGRSGIITGAGQGLGACIARTYAGAGASLMLCARSADDLRRVQDELAPTGANVLVRPTDVSDARQVQQLVDMACEAFGGIDFLVNNAGIHGPKGNVEINDPAAWTEAIHVNLVGPFLTCRAVIPHMKLRGYGKIINLSGGGATKAMPGMSAYAASKAGLVRLTETLAEELRGVRIDVNAVAPGALATRLLDDVLQAGPERVGADYYGKMLQLRNGGATPLQRGADLCLYLASSESDGITGKLISAVWDPWSELQQHAADLASTDIYTLRRIVPKERGKAWGG